MEEPLDLRAEPDDEAARAALPAGTFSGLYLRDARETLEAKLATKALRPSRERWRVGER